MIVFAFHIVNSITIFKKTCIYVTYMDYFVNQSVCIGISFACYLQKVGNIPMVFFQLADKQGGKTVSKKIGGYGAILFIKKNAKYVIKSTIRRFWSVVYKKMLPAVLPKPKTTII